MKLVTVCFLLFAAANFLPARAEESITCGPNQVAETCGSACPPKCSPVTVKSAANCLAIICYKEPHCWCAPGYVLKGPTDGPCVKPSEC